MRLDEALERIKLSNSKKAVKIIRTQSFKENLDYKIDDCHVIKQVSEDDHIILTVAYFNI